MFRLNRLTDYGIVLMTWVAHSPDQDTHTARDLAAGTQLPLPTVSKLLKELSHHGLLASHRGVKGGYSLARKASEITIAEIIDALEGPIGFTECSISSGVCDLEPSCLVRSNSRAISQALRGALEKLTLSDLTRPMQAMPSKGSHSRMLTSISVVSGRVQ